MGTATAPPRLGSRRAVAAAKVELGPEPSGAPVISAEPRARARRARSASASSEARRWLARELHDGPVQTLMTMIVALEERRGGDVCPAERDELVDSARDVMRGLREIVYSLREEAEVAVDVAVGTRTLLAGFEARTGIAAGLTAPDEPVTLAAPAALEVRRILEEALTNVARHSGARTVAVTLQVIEGSLAMTVKDDGRGFEPSLTTPGIGTRGMHERARIAGGRLTVDGGAGRGTTVRVLVPLGGRR